MLYTTKSKNNNDDDFTGYGYTSTACEQMIGPQKQTLVQTTNWLYFFSKQKKDFSHVTNTKDKETSVQHISSKPTCNTRRLD